MQSFFKQAVKYFPFWYILLIWALHIAKVLLDWQTGWLGTHPMHAKEWYTFLSGGLFHSDWEHLMNNTYPLAITGMFLVFLYGRFSNFIFLTTYFFTGLFIFLFARQNAHHIGASGVAYCWAFLLAAAGFFRKDRVSLGLGLAVAMLYGSMIWGVLPGQKGVSWDGHLIGALTGIVLAWLYRNVNNVESKQEEEETDEDDDFDSSYDARRFQHSPYRYIQKQIEEEE